MGQSYLDLQELLLMRLAIATLMLLCHSRTGQSFTSCCAGVVYYDQNITLAEHLVARCGLDAVFIQSGAEAVEAALKCAVFVKKKQMGCI